MTSQVQIGNRTVGELFSPLIIAEVGQAHDGSITMAHDYIDAIAETGADGVKFQCHLAEFESYPQDKWRNPPLQGFYFYETRFDYWKRMEFDLGQWIGLQKHASDRGLLFLCSPFSQEAAAILDDLVPAWKLPSGELTNVALLQRIRQSGKPVIISTGMATYAEIENLKTHFERDCDVILLHCVSEYPTPAARARLGGIAELRALYPSTVVGLSDHSANIYAGLAAAALGAKMIEVHVALSKLTSHPDASVSISMPELRQLVEGATFIHAASQPISSRDEFVQAPRIAAMRTLFMERHLRNREYRESKRVNHP